MRNPICQFRRKEKKRSWRPTALVATVVLSVMAPSVRAWDHPGHMTTAAIGYSEIERTRPELIEKLGLLFLAHPEAGPLWVASSTQEPIRCGNAPLLAEARRFGWHLETATTEAGAINHAIKSKHINRHNVSSPWKNP